MSNNPPSAQGTQNKDVHDPVSDSPPFVTGDPKQRCTWSCVWQPSLCYRGPKAKMYLILCPTTLPLLLRTQSKDIHDPVSDNPPFVTGDPKQRCTWSCVQQPSLCYRGPKIKMYMISCLTILPLLLGTQTKMYMILCPTNSPLLHEMYMISCLTSIPLLHGTQSKDGHEPMSKIHPSVAGDPRQRCTWSRVWHPSLCYRGPKTKIDMIPCLKSIPLLHGTQSKDARWLESGEDL